MITDALSRLPEYLATPPWNRVFSFLNTLSERTPDGEYSLDGERAYARVMSYDTVPADEAKLEAHRSYIDLQMSLTGCEEIDVFPPDGLTVTAPYDPQRDIEFYAADSSSPLVMVINRPGLFTVLFPQDVHRPKVRVPGAAREVKKVVVKVRIE